MPGNHSLKLKLNLTDISNITLTKEESNSTPTIICTDEGTIYCENVRELKIQGLTFFKGDLFFYDTTSVLSLINCNNILITNTTFEGYDVLSGRAVYLQNIQATIGNCCFTGHSEDNGGAVYLNGTNLTIYGSVFTGNSAWDDSGGAVYGFNSALLIEESIFLNNFAVKEGGALCFYLCTVTMTEHNIFQGNHCNKSKDDDDDYSIDDDSNCQGGAIFTASTLVIVTGKVDLTHNEANMGGAIYIIATSVIFSGNATLSENLANVGAGMYVDSHSEISDTENINFISNKGVALYVDTGNVTFSGNTCILNNKGYAGGGIYALNSIITLDDNCSITNNTASLAGGAIMAQNSTMYFQGLIIIEHNTAAGGGALYLYDSNAIFSGHTIIANNTAQHGGGIAFVGGHIKITGYFSLASNDATNGGALFLTMSNATFSGHTVVTNNKAQIGGGISTINSHIKITGNCSFIANGATDGGAMNTLRGTVSFQGPTQFSHNTADKDGGALYAAGTKIEIKERVDFTHNSADNGGAMYFENGASLNLLAQHCNILISSSFNSAKRYGGLIYHEDSATKRQCIYQTDDYNLDILPYCFLRANLDYCFLINSTHNSARKDGSVLYGGLIDRCVFDKVHEPGLVLGQEYIRDRLIDYKSQADQNPIQSLPYELNKCKCEICNSTIIHIHTGQKFIVHLLAKTQTGNSSTIVTAITSATAKLETYQTSQPLPDHCHPLSYNVYSTESHEEMVLYPDGPCRDTGTARVVIDVTLLPCPDGFTQSGEICTCEDRLRDYPINCIIADTPYLTKTADSNFWIGVSYANTNYQGLILGNSCPAEYCKKGDINVTIDNPDVQCDLNRSGLLCGACAANYSLMLGSSHCQFCPNTYLALLLPFAAAGMALVVFLTCLRLTVATGTMNSVILYTNILQVNKIIFFPNNTRNLLTVYVAWLNLDLGFQTCFYDGLDAYALTWLQFAFPLYVWFIIGLIIFISRYSITVSKIIGSNPIAVLATLLLMSYTKILKVIIEVYSYDYLDYPGSKTTAVSVWLKDANVPYLKSKHLFLTVVTSLVLVFIFLPYTILLLLGHKLYRFTGKKRWHWLNRLKPLLDSYYAPYKIHTRYWTGFLLLLRCALYIIFSLTRTSRSLFTIIVTCSAIGFVIGYFYSGRIYKNRLVNLVEASIYFNLFVLSATTLTGLNTAPLVYSLVGLVFVIMIALSAYQFHLLYIAKTTLWLRLKNKWPRFRKKLSEEQITPPNTINPSHDQHKLVTKTVIELREPLLDS